MEPSTKPAEPREAREGEAALRRLIVAQLADALGIEPAEIDTDRPLAEHGLSSRDAVMLAGYLEAELDQPLPATFAWDHPTVNDLVRRGAARRVTRRRRRRAGQQRGPAREKPSRARAARGPARDAIGERRLRIFRDR